VDVPRATITVSGVPFVAVNATTVMVAGTIYDFALTWEKNNATGLKLYLNGALEDDDSTTTQTTDYSSVSPNELYVGARNGGFEYGIVTLEHLGFWTGHVLTTAQIAALRAGCWPHMIGLPRPALWLPMFPQLTSRIPDLSGNSRSIEAAGITGTLSAAGLLRQWMDPGSVGAGGGKGAAGAVPPNPWTLLATIEKPSPGQPPPATYVAGGLTNGVAYQFHVTALDDVNESTISNVVEATPSAPAPPEITTPLPWRRSRRYSKYRPSQQ
jgi:hypothetical protein